MTMAYAGELRQRCNSQLLYSRSDTSSIADALSNMPRRTLGVKWMERRYQAEAIRIQKLVNFMDNQQLIESDNK